MSSSVSYKETLLERLSSQFNKIWNQERGLQKSQCPYSLVNWENAEVQWIGKKCFQLVKKEFYFKPIADSAHNTEFFTLRKFDLLTFDVLCKQTMKAL